MGWYLSDSEADERCMIRKDKHNVSWMLISKNVSSSWCATHDTHWEDQESGAATHCVFPV